jgi:AraC-like DNA-binding protein
VAREQRPEEGGEPGEGREPGEGAGQTFVERLPVRALGDLVHTVWVQRIGDEPYRHRTVPTGGVELLCPIGAPPRLMGPRTGPSVEELPPGTTVLGVRFRPGTAAAVLGLPGAEVADLILGADEVWGPAAHRLGELVAGAPSPGAALDVVQDHLVGRRAHAAPPDPLVAEAVRRLLARRAGSIGALGAELGLSASQLRRRCLAAVGVGPKGLQRTLRFQGFLALVQAVGRGEPAPASDLGGLAALAARCGYADHAHLTRECVRMTGLTPTAFLANVADTCRCGHDHAASFTQLLPGGSGGDARFVQAADRRSA